MASTIYDTYKKAALDHAASSIDLDTDTIRARLVNTGTDYTFAASHASMTPVTKYLATTDQALANITVSSTGVVDNTATITFAAVDIDAAKTADAVVIFKFVTDDAGSFPIAYLEFASAVTPNGGDIVVDWNASGLYAL